MMQVHSLVTDPCPARLRASHAVKEPISYPGTVVVPPRSYTVGICMYCHNAVRMV